MARIVEARHTFNDGLPADLRGDIEIYDPDQYTQSGSLMDNVVFGRLNSKNADGAERIQAMVRDLLNQLGLYERGSVKRPRLWVVSHSEMFPL